jgi:HEPN domain-containing protein
MNKSLDNIEIEKIIKHWVEISDKDFKSMKNLFKQKEYYWCLFVGHLVIEKLLKAYYTKNKKQQAPFTHNLLRLAELSGLTPISEHSDWLDSITTFNINARYDSYKQEFYKKCTKNFANEWVNKISELRKWIKDKLS